MWSVSGIRAAFNYAYGLAIYIGYDAMWLASGICEAFSYVGWQVGLRMKLRGWLLDFLRYAPVWPVQESGMKLCDQCTHCM